MSGREGRVPKQRRARGAAESLGSIVLAFESIVVFLGGLAIYGLGALPPQIPGWWGIVAGAVLAIVMVLTGRVLRHHWGIALGWALQLVVALGAVLVPALALVALIFGAMWGYATIKGASLDARNARLASEADIVNGD
jgi:hypothetical protein